MKIKPINFAEKFGKFSEQWSPRVIAEMNDYQFKLVKIQGEFVWHQHADTDEVFVVLDGEMAIEFRDGRVELKAGEMVMVPKGVEHKPIAAAEARPRRKPGRDAQRSNLVETLRLLRRAAPSS